MEQWCCAFNSALVWRLANLGKVLASLYRRWHLQQPYVCSSRHIGEFVLRQQHRLLSQNRPRLATADPTTSCLVLPACEAQTLRQFVIPAEAQLLISRRPFWSLCLCFGRRDGAVVLCFECCSRLAVGQRGHRPGQLEQTLAHEAAICLLQSSHLRVCIQVGNPWCLYQARLSLRINPDEL